MTLKRGEGGNDQIHFIRSFDIRYVEVSSHWRFVKTSLVPLHNFGGVRIHQKEEYTGRNGRRFAYQKMRVELASV